MKLKNNELNRQLNKLRRNKKLLWLGVLFLVLIILWILVSIFATSKTSSISPELRELAKSFVPRLESKVFTEIADQRAFSAEELNDFSIFVFDQDEVTKDTILVDIMQKGNLVEDQTDAFAKEQLQASNSTQTIITEEVSSTDEEVSTASANTNTNVNDSPVLVEP